MGWKIRPSKGSINKQLLIQRARETLSEQIKIQDPEYEDVVNVTCYRDGIRVWWRSAGNVVHSEKWFFKGHAPEPQKWTIEGQAF